MSQGPETATVGRRRRGPTAPKGRQVDPAALAEVRTLLGDRPRRRDLLVEHLHLIQDRHGHLPVALLVALAEEMRLAMAEVYEVATFYAHFDVVTERESAPPPLTIRVCDSLPCALAGAEALMDALRTEFATGVRVRRAPCMGACAHAPACSIGDVQVAAADVAKVSAVVASGATGSPFATPRPFSAYRDDGGYRLAASLPAQDRVLAEIEAAGLRGLGGAGFPTARKWRAVAQEPGPRLMVINADEGEPGTFKDRHCLENDPHRVLEGALIAAGTVGVERIYLYLRDEYPAIRLLLQKEISALESAGIVPPGFIDLRRGAGAYICGEESAMIESVEGKRGYPRHRPPYVAQVGLFGRPTLVQNVETLFWVREILERGGAWFRAQGRRGGSGLRHFSVSGRVRQPGVRLAPAGITARELIDEYCGGMAEGHSFAAYLPGGASGGILPARLADIALDFGTLEPHGCFIGSHGVIVLSDRDDLTMIARNLMAFFADESCGQCTPCRVGTEKMGALLSASRWNRPLIGELSQAMADASICGLGQAAPNPVRTLLKYFPEAVR